MRRWSWRESEGALPKNKAGKIRLIHGVFLGYFILWIHQNALIYVFMERGRVHHSPKRHSTKKTDKAPEIRASRHFHPYETIRRNTTNTPQPGIFRGIFRGTHSTSGTDTKFRTRSPFRLLHKVGREQRGKGPVETGTAPRLFPVVVVVNPSAFFAGEEISVFIAVFVGTALLAPFERTAVFLKVATVRP